MKKFIFIFIILIQSCSDPELGYTEGEADGWAALYNTKCEIRGTIIHGEWKNKKYMTGYYDGGEAANLYIEKNGCDL